VTYFTNFLTRISDNILTDDEVCVEMKAAKIDENARIFPRISTAPFGNSRLQSAMVLSAISRRGCVPSKRDYVSRVYAATEATDTNSR